MENVYTYIQYEQKDITMYILHHLIISTITFKLNIAYTLRS